jgi:hypothetical protein
MRQSDVGNLHGNGFEKTFETICEYSQASLFMKKEACIFLNLLFVFYCFVYAPVT